MSPQHASTSLNVTVMAGLSLACISLLWGNRLLPLGMVDLARRLAEVGVSLALTTQTEPGAAVAAYLAGDSLPVTRLGKGVCAAA